MKYYNYISLIFLFCTLSWSTTSTSALNLAHIDVPSELKQQHNPGKQLTGMAGENTVCEANMPCQTHNDCGSDGVCINNESSPTSMACSCDSATGEWAGGNDSDGSCANPRDIRGCQRN